MTIHRLAARLARATQLAELTLQRLNEDRLNPRRVRQAVTALRLCDRIQTRMLR